MDEEKSYPYLRRLLRCGLFVSFLIAMLAFLVVSFAFHSSAPFCRESFEATAFFLGFMGLLITLGTLYASTIPSPVVAYKAASPMMYMYSGDTGTGIKVFNKIVRAGTDQRPMACLFVAGLFLILEGLLVSVLLG